MKVVSIKPTKNPETVKLLQIAAKEADLGTLREVYIIGKTDTDTLTFYKSSFTNNFELISGLFFGMLQSAGVEIPTEPHIIDGGDDNAS